MAHDGGGDLAPAAQDAHDLARMREPSDLWPGVVLSVGLGTLGFVILSLAGVWVFERWMNLDSDLPPPDRFPQPTLQSDPAGDLRAYRAEQAVKLEAYGWADQQHAHVQIPIERAMALLATRGATAYEPLDPPQWPGPRRR